MSAAGPRSEPSAVVDEPGEARVEHRMLSAAVLSRIYASVASGRHSEHVEGVKSSCAASSFDEHIGTRCVMLCFNRHPKEFEQALLHSDPARRLVERGVNVKPVWARGAKIFVENLTE